MILTEHIDDIRNRLKENAYKDEAAVSNHIVNRLLQALKWPMFSPQIIIPEYSVEGRRVDFALCHPPDKPLIFIEVKQVGKIQGAEKQLFEYAFHEGIPILVLTDGQKWRFFHTVGTGNYADRLVHELDLISGKSDEIAECLNRYLNYEIVKAGEAVQVIAEDYQNVVNERRLQKALPRAWDLLVRDLDEHLLEIIAAKTKELCGICPTPEQVKVFLKDLSVLSVEPTPTPNGNVVPDKPPSSPYEYVGEQLTGTIARPLIIELFGNKGKTRKKEIVNIVTKTHRERGGLDAEANTDQLINNALKNLEGKDSAKNVEQGYWEVYKDSKKIE